MIKAMLNNIAIGCMVSDLMINSYISDPCQSLLCYKTSCDDDGNNMCVCNEGLMWNSDNTDCIGKKTLQLHNLSSPLSNL